MAEAAALLEALRDQVASVTEHGLGLLRRVRAGGLRTAQGVSLLEVRAQALLQYLQDLALLMAAKARGGSLRPLPALPRLLETRLVLEKLRPAERRLRHQLEKLLHAGGDESLRFRPRPANMAAADDVTDDVTDDDASPGAIKAPGLGGGRRYVPPRLVPVQYDAAGEERERRAREASRRRALSSSVIRELREELGEEPLEVGGARGGGGGAVTSSAAAARERYEEAMLLRLRESRRERAQRRRQRGGDVIGGLDGITKFGDIGALLGAANQEAPPPKKKKAAPKRKAANGKRRRRRGVRRR